MELQTLMRWESNGSSSSRYIKTAFYRYRQKSNYYDLRATGDLGKVGKKITEELLLEYGYDISSNYI